MSTPYYAMHVTLLGESNLDPVNPQSMLRLKTPLTFVHTERIMSKETTLTNDTITYHGNEEEVIGKTLDTVMTIMSGMIEDMGGGSQIDIKNRLKAKYLIPVVEAAAV